MSQADREKLEHRRYLVERCTPAAAHLFLQVPTGSVPTESQLLRAKEDLQRASTSCEYLILILDLYTFA